MSGAPADKILVIRHGALGEFVLSTGAFKAIRDHHSGAEITLLTGSPYVAFARASGWFDAIWVDDRPSLFRFWKWVDLRNRFRAAGFDRVYDLQTSDRTNLYFHFFQHGREPEWSGTATGCSHPHDNPDRHRLHPIERQAEQLALAGIDASCLPDVSWARGNVGRFGLPADYIVLVAGGSAHRPTKRWPADGYGAIAARADAAGITPVLVGAAAERDLLRAVAAGSPNTVDLGGRTDLVDLVELGRGARQAIGNDTGPMHLIAATGCPSLVLFSKHSSPRRSAPRGAHVTVLRRDSLARLDAAEVAAAAGLATGLD